MNEHRMTEQDWHTATVFINSLVSDNAKKWVCAFIQGEEPSEAERASKIISDACEELKNAAQTAAREAFVLGSVYEHFEDAEQRDKALAVIDSLLETGVIKYE